MLMHEESRAAYGVSLQATHVSVTFALPTCKLLSLFYSGVILQPIILCVMSVLCGQDLVHW